MADVMLKNAAGESKTYEGIETVTLPTSDGGTATFSLGGSGNADWAQTDPTQSDYIKNKPFGENADGTIVQLDNKYLSILDKTEAKETEILPETSVTFTDGQGSLNPAVELISGSSVRVIWDGTEYTCLATDMTIDGAACVVIGNAAVVGLGDDTGEPFFLAYATSYGMNLFVISTTEESTHTVQIFQWSPEQYTLKEEHVGNVDYETKVINKPFGEVAEAGTVVTDHDAEYDSTDFGFVLTDIDTFESYVNDKFVLEGATYSVEIAGITYDGVGMTAEALKQIIPSFDGSQIAGIGIAIYQDGTLWGALASMQNIIWSIQPLAPDSYNSSESYQVKITVVEAIKKIDAKYLPMDAIKACIDDYIGEVLGGDY